ncbi:HugZ family protein [Algirhabdus cladophorae]|uniref:HugZ family pyridoxamine 5'-phosphate oxidase n=1 Tax=Algirhabdus cladophorae TaxID=3377108 RepID=UPI003B84A0F8
MKNPIRPVDDDARALAVDLIAQAKFGALAVETTEGPMVSRIALAQIAGFGLVSLVSDLSHHTQALQHSPRVSLLVGEPGEKGDALTHPRLTIQAQAVRVEHDTDTFREIAHEYLERLPKSKLYIDFLDFVFLQFKPVQAHLNGGFGKAYVLQPSDLAA